LTVGAPPGSPTASFRAQISARILIAGGTLMLLGLALRIRGAQGELWLDEIWSLHLVKLLRQGQFLLESLALDNNHYLNTLYLFILGPDASALALRAFSILLGIAAIPAAGYALRRSGTAGVIAAMALFAGGYFFVNYGSEARGYAGLILMTVLAILLVERDFERPDPSTPRWFASVAVIGFLFQPIMVMSLAIVGLWALWFRWRETRDIRRCMQECRRLFMPALAGLLPLIVLIGGAVFRSNDYVIAAKTPFSLAHFLEGTAGLYRSLLGLPDIVPDLAVLLAPVVTLLIAHRILPSPRVMLGVIALVLVPLVVLVAQPPNVQFPRYYLPSGIVFLLLLAGLFAEAWRGAAKWRLVAAIAFLLVAAGNGIAVGKLFQVGRGDPDPALRVVAAASQPVLASQRDLVAVEVLGPRHGLQLSAIPFAALCATKPPFLLASNADAPERVTVSQPGCAVTYGSVLRAPYWGLSGTPWTLYRAE